MLSEIVDCIVFEGRAIIKCVDDSFWVFAKPPGEPPIVTELKVGSLDHKQAEVYYNRAREIYSNGG